MHLHRILFVFKGNSIGLSMKSFNFFKSFNDNLNTMASLVVLNVCNPVRFSMGSKFR